MAQQYVSPRMSLSDYEQLGFKPRDIPSDTLTLLHKQQTNFFLSAMERNKFWNWDNHPGNQNIGKYGISVDSFVGVVTGDDDEKMVITLTWNQLKKLNEDGFDTSNFICRADLLLGFVFDEQYFMRLGLKPVAWHMEKYLEDNDITRDGTKVLLTTFFNTYEKDNMFFYFNLRWGEGLKNMRFNRHWTGRKPEADIYQRCLVKHEKSTPAEAKKLATMKTTKVRRVTESLKAAGTIPSEQSKFADLDQVSSGTPLPSDDEETTEVADTTTTA